MFITYHNVLIAVTVPLNLCIRNYSCSNFQQIHRYKHLQLISCIVYLVVLKDSKSYAVFLKFSRWQSTNHLNNLAKDLNVNLNYEMNE